MYVFQRDWNRRLIRDTVTSDMSPVCFSPRYGLPYVCHSDTAESELLRKETPVSMKTEILADFTNLIGKPRKKPLLNELYKGRTPDVSFVAKVTDIREQVARDEFLNAAYVNTKLNSFVINGLTPHIQLYSFSMFMTDKEAERTFKVKAASTSYGVLAMELVGNRTLHDFMVVHCRHLHAQKSEVNNNEQFKVMKRTFNYKLKAVIFQVLYTLATIQLKYPSFRMNDLHLGNVMMVEHKNEHLTRVTYHLGGSTTRRIDLTRLRRTPVIIDFGLSTLNSKHISVVNQSVKRRNRYIDINKFVNNILYILDKCGGTQFVDDDLLSFLSHIVPGSKRVGLDPENGIRLAIWHKRSPFEWTGEGKIKTVNGKRVRLSEPAGLLPIHLIFHPIFTSFNASDGPGYDFYMTKGYERAHLKHKARTTSVDEQDIDIMN